MSMRCRILRRMTRTTCCCKGPMAPLKRRATGQMWPAARPRAGRLWRISTATGWWFWWLTLQVHQPAPNTDAIGAWIEVKVGETVQRQEITIGGGHAGGILGPRHFGIGPAAEAEVRVIWPDGTTGDWTKVAANGFFDLAPGQAPAVVSP